MERHQAAPKCSSVFTFANGMIAVELESLQQRHEGGNVTGVIFLELSDGAFPERGWSDFPVIILGWWADALLQLEDPARRNVQWLFMDGPQSLALSKVTDAASTDAFELSHVHTSLIDAAERVVTHCDQHRMFSGGLETLKMNIGHLKANPTVQRTGASRRAYIQIRPLVAAGSRR